MARGWVIAAALMARRELDEFYFHTEQSQLTRGNVADLEALKRAIILETLAEQVTLLEQARDAGGGSRKGIKAEMLKLIDDPDRFHRFNDEDKAAIREIARGVSFFAKIRFDHLHEGRCHANLNLRREVRKSQLGLMLRSRLATSGTLRL